jgi:site-specific recombinase XerD
MDSIVEYLNYLEINRSLTFNSLRLYKRDLLDFHTFIKKHFGNNFDIKNLIAINLDTFRQWIIKQGKSTAAVNRKLTAVHGYWIWLRDNKQVNGDPFLQLMRSSQYRNKSARHLSIEEINALLDCDEHDLRSKMILELFYATGIRIGELVALTIEDIDLENQLLTIPRSTRFKERLVPFNKLLCSYIQEYIALHNLMLENTLLQSKQGERLSEREIFRLVQEAGNRVGINDLSPSIIRNSFIHHMKDKGAYPALLRDLTGQRNV